MLRLSTVPQEYYQIISDISDDKFYTFVIQDWGFKRFPRAKLNIYIADAAHARKAIEEYTPYENGFAPVWEGNYKVCDFYKNIIDNNIPCVLMHKVKNDLVPEIDTIVCFMTGETTDIFLVHPKDLTKWIPE